MEENLKSIGEDILKIEKLIAKCDECGLKECIQCEVCWDEVQSIKHLLSEYKKNKKSIDEMVPKERIKMVLSMLEAKDKKIQRKDSVVRDIVKRLDADIKNISQTKSEKYTDDYRRCRLKAYKTKTRELRDYIEKKYFKEEE